ncbi:MAG: type II toxin-antitoxin system VapC family toxin [Acidimicrobiia bacterium]
MIVVNASVLFEVVADTPASEPMRERLAADPDHAAPHLIDVEVFGVIRREWLRGALDSTAAGQAVADLRDWPGDRYGHRPFLQRAWELRDSIRGWDAIYVALAEALDVPLLTTDGRLATASGPTCQIEVVVAGRAPELGRAGRGA